MLCKNSFDPHEMRGGVPNSSTSIQVGVKGPKKPSGNYAKMVKNMFGEASDSQIQSITQTSPTRERRNLVVDGRHVSPEQDFWHVSRQIARYNLQIASVTMAFALKQQELVTFPFSLAGAYKITAIPDKINWSNGFWAC